MIRHEKVSDWNVSRLLLRSTLRGAGAGCGGSASPPSLPPSPSRQPLSHPVIGSDRKTNLQVNQATRHRTAFSASVISSQALDLPMDEPIATDFLRDALSMHRLRDRRA